MRDLLGKCGNNCGHCQAFIENSTTDEARQRCSDGWSKYLGFNQSPAVCHCAGCQVLEEHPEFLNNRDGIPNTPASYGMRRSAGNCGIQKCAFMNRVKSCAHCSNYACEDLTVLFRSEPVREQIALQTGGPVSQEDYIAFIEPYERKKHLDTIHTSLNPAHLTEPVKLPAVRARITPFPEKLVFHEKKASSIKNLYDMFAAIKSMKADTYARQDTLEKTREFLFRFLWAFGCFSTSKEKHESSLLLDADTYRAQKISSLLPRMTDYFKILEEHGIHCKVIPLTKEREQWLMPNGWLRGKSWQVEMSFDEKIGGASTAEALREYAGLLEAKHGRRAYAHFSNADMTVLARD